MPNYELAAQLAEAMGETWAALDITRRDFWLRLADEVERIYGEYGGEPW